MANTLLLSVNFDHCLEIVSMLNVVHGCCMLLLTEAVKFCSDAEFACIDGTCIQLHRLCDGTPQCPDASDELTCRKVLQYILLWKSI